MDLANSEPISLFADQVRIAYEANECVVRRVLTESVTPVLTMARLTKLSALPHNAVAATLRAMIADKAVIVVNGADKRHSYVLANRHTAPVIKERSTWYTPELKGYAANMRRFAAACEASR